jgi:hypothetical protein
MATLTQLIGRVRFFIDEPSSQNFTDADITYSLNRGQEEVVKEIVHENQDYFETFTDINLVAGTEFYTPPALFMKEKRIERLDTNEVLSAIDINEKVVSTASISSLILSSQPTGWYFLGGQIGFSPVPVAPLAVRLFYVPFLAELVNGSDVSPIPQDYHDMMAISAAIDMFTKDQEDTSALQAKWDVLLNRLQRTLRDRQIQEPKHVRRVETSYGPLN